MFVEYKFLLEKNADSNFCHSLISKLNEVAKIENQYKVKRVGNFLIFTTNNNKIQNYLGENKIFELEYQIKNNQDTKREIVKSICYLVEVKEKEEISFEENEEIKMNGNFCICFSLEGLLKHLNIDFYSNQKIRNKKISFIKNNQIRNSLQVKEINVNLKNKEEISCYFKNKIQEIFVERYGILIDFSKANFLQLEQDKFYTKGNEKRIFNTFNFNGVVKVNNKEKFKNNLNFSLTGKSSYGYGFLDIEKI